MLTQIDRIRRYAYIIAFAWTFLILSSFAGSYYQQKHNILEIARAEARVAFEKDILYRTWATNHGGIYVPTNEQTRPNPLLSHIMERDISTPSGKELTLVNPAYMTRQVFELADKQKNIVRGHITSLNPLRQENTPDPWEKEALQAFDNGEEEVSGVQIINERPHLRLMRPFITDHGCLKCHAAQGYKQGDIRGGISITVPMALFSDTMKTTIMGSAAAHGMIWILGTGMILAGRRSLCKNTRDLQKSEERYRTVADYTADWEYWIAPDGHFEYMSPSCETVCGYTQEEFYNDRKLLPQIIHPDDRRLYDNHVHAVMESGYPEPIDFRIITRDGKQRWISHTCQAVYDSQARANGRRAANRDITDRKRAEEELHEQTVALEQEIAEHQVAQEALQQQTIALEKEIVEHGKAEEQLRHSQKLEAVGQLAGGVAHDFNNMLTVIGGYCNLLQMSLEADDENMEKVNQILGATERAANLTRSLLAFSRKTEMKLMPANINEIVRGVEKFLKRIIGEDIILTTSLGDEPLNAIADSGQIEQSLMNLATNARDAMPKGGMLRIETRKQEIDSSFVQAHGYGTPGNYVLLTVSDTGNGMDEETQTKMFNPFFTTKEVGKGTGLGMSIVYGIIKQHNGFINVYSEQDKGTIFRIYIPCAETKQMEPQKPHQDEYPQTGNETILVAEDDPHVQLLVQRILRQSGYEVILAANGQDAIEKFLAHRDVVKLILMDLIMPIKSGKAACDEIRQMQPDIKILFTSGYTADFMQDRGELEDGIELIAKPVKPLDLVRKIRAKLDS